VVGGKEKIHEIEDSIFQFSIRELRLKLNPQPKRL